MEEWNNSIDRHYKNSIKRTLIVPVNKSVAQQRITAYLLQVGYKIISSEPILTAERLYNRWLVRCPPYNNSVLNVRFKEDNQQTKIEINYSINSMLPWEKAFWFTEIKDLLTALNSDRPVNRTTKKILLIGRLIYIAIALGSGGLILIGFILAFGIMFILPNVTGYPQDHWVNGSIAAFVVILLYVVVFLYIYSRVRHSKVKEW